MEPFLTITFTGERRNRQYQVQISGKDVYLPIMMLKVLMDLVIARGSTTPGFVRIRAVTVHRLRKAIDRVLGAGTGNSLIVTGFGEEYRLSIPASELGTRIGINPGFVFEKGIISPEEASRLRLAVSESSRIPIPLTPGMSGGAQSRPPLGASK